ncbi:MAG TPA: hypothetical protein VHN80_26930 [Kineosporiaceae bacterium]|nr:hypothetical protein [Kineosporiaceae bacterium]
MTAPTGPGEPPERSERSERSYGGHRTDRTDRRSRSKPPPRVRITGPRMAARATPMTPRREIDEQTGVGEVYMRSLMRAQLRLGLSVLVVVAIALGSLPLLFTADPRLGAIRVVSVPLPWLLIGVSIYPLLVLAAWWHVRAAERAERDFAEIVERR